MMLDEGPLSCLIQLCVCLKVSINKSLKRCPSHIMTITKWIAAVLAPLLIIFTEHESPGPLGYGNLLEGDQSWVASIALSQRLSVRPVVWISLIVITYCNLEQPFLFSFYFVILKYNLFLLASQSGIRDLSSLSRGRTLPLAVEARGLNPWTDKEVSATLFKVVSVNGLIA